MRTVIERFEALALEQGVRVVGTVIDQAVRRDARRDYDQDKMRQARQELIDFIARRPDEVRAQLSCIDASGNEEQSRRLYQAAARREDDRWWIGFSDRGEEDRFQWRDGAAVGFTSWSRGEPDNDGCNQDCAALKQDADGTWHDTHCGQHEPFICR
jgi:hypothetical protein